MKLKFVAAAALTCCLGFGSALAQGEPQAVRQDMMKQVGNAMGVLTAIARGQRTYDAEAVRTSVATISEVAKAFPDQFPAGTETGQGTEAAPAIWQNMDDFRAKAQKLGSDADTVLASLPADQAAVGTAMQSLGGNCSACHQNYRQKR